MKTVVALLVAANLLLFGAAQGWFGAEVWHRMHPNAGEPARMEQQVAPELIRVPTPAGAAPGTAPTGTENAPAQPGGEPRSAIGAASAQASARQPGQAEGQAAAGSAVVPAPGTVALAAPAPVASDPAGAMPAAGASAPSAGPQTAAQTAADPTAGPRAAPPANGATPAAQPAAAPAMQPGARVACTEFGPLPADDAGKLLARLRNEPGLKLGSRTQPESTTWLVHLPPQADRAALDRAAADLRAHGVEDFYVLQEPAAFRNAISLGVFRSVDGANTQAAQLGGRGIKGIKVTARPSASSLGFVEVRDLAVASQPALDRAARDWPAQRWHACAQAVAAR